MAKKPTKKQIEKMAYEIRQFLLDNHLWVDVCIYFNGKALGTSDENGFHYNDPKTVCIREDVDPKDYFQYVGDILSMSFEGDLCGCLNYYGEYGHAFDEKIQNGLSAIFKKYGCYYELGHHWNLTLHPI